VGASYFLYYLISFLLGISDLFFFKCTLLSQSSCQYHLFKTFIPFLVLLSPLPCSAVFYSTGDYAVKAVGVIPDPETFIFELEPVDRFMILGIISLYHVWELSYSSPIFTSFSYFCDGLFLSSFFSDIE
jgi:hypothetical protein